MDTYLQPKVSCCFITTIIRQVSIHAIRYDIYLSLSYNSSITDIEHPLNYTAFGLPQTHQVG